MSQPSTSGVFGKIGINVTTKQQPAPVQSQTPAQPADNKS